MLSLPANAALAKPNTAASDANVNFWVLLKSPFNNIAARPDLSNDIRYSLALSATAPKIPL